MKGRIISLPFSILDSSTVNSDRLCVKTSSLERETLSSWWGDGVVDSCINSWSVMRNFYVNKQTAKCYLSTIGCNKFRSYKKIILKKYPNYLQLVVAFASKMIEARTARTELERRGRQSAQSPGHFVCPGDRRCSQERQRRQSSYFWQRRPVCSLFANVRPRLIVQVDSWASACAKDCAPHVAQFLKSAIVRYPSGKTKFSQDNRRIWHWNRKITISLCVECYKC